MGLASLTLLIPDGWPRTLLIVGIVVGWAVAHKRLASRLRRALLAPRRDLTNVDPCGDTAPCEARVNRAERPAGDLHLCLKPDPNAQSHGRDKRPPPSGHDPDQEPADYAHQSDRAPELR